VSALPDGRYASNEDYSVLGYPVDTGEEGDYHHGGSWYLYDMLFVIDSYAHGVEGALDEVIWRGTLDFKLGGTYFEHNHTVTGTSNKPNQGWDAAAYVIWKKLMEKGFADNTFFDAFESL
jgi:hypothetical protein